jgi:hypothetical protein
MDRAVLQQLSEHIERLEQYLSLESGENQVWFSPATSEIVNEIAQKYPK